MLAIIAPGQGAQTPGFLTSWIEDKGAHELLGTWSEDIGLDLVRLGTLSDADEIRETSHAQPLLVAAGLISFMQPLINKRYLLTILQATLSVKLPLHLLLAF